MYAVMLFVYMFFFYYEWITLFKSATLKNGIMSVPADVNEQ